MILSGSPFDCDCLVALLSVTLPGSRVCIVVRWYNKYIMYVLGMSFCVGFKVRTFGNKHPDGSNVRIFSDQVIILHVHLHVY